MVRSRFSAVHAVLILLAAALPAQAAGMLNVEIINGYNLVVDSNVTSPSTYAPSAAYIGARICNTGDAPIANVFAHTGNYNGGVGSTPGIFPIHNSTGDLVHPQLTNTGNYSLTLESGDVGVSDGTRYIGTLGIGECRVVYWLISYPQCVNAGGNSDSPPCAASIAGGVKPDDDLSLNYDVWASTTTVIPQPTVSVRRDFTLRNEISASANKIWPNTTSKVPNEYLEAIQALIGWGTLGPDGQPLSDTNPVYPGQRVITTQGIWYDLGNVGAGFDNDGDLIPDQNAWLQPVGDADAFDAGCFRMVNVYGIIIVKLKSGGELLIPFQNELYFEHLPDNTGVVGLVYYQFIATDQGCTAAMTPYQEAASGFDNEKFSADFGLSNGLTSGTFGPGLTFSKCDGLNGLSPCGIVSSTTTGSTLTYTASATNTTGVALGAPDYGIPLVVSETIPAGTTFVAGSADDSPNTNLTEPTGTGSYTEDSTDIDGNVDTCTINYNITSSSWAVLYSNNNGSTWSTTEPVGVTNIQWLLFTTIALDGDHDGSACVAPDGLYDNGTLSTSLPPGKSFAVRFQVTIASTAGPVVCNTAGVGFGSSSAATAQECTIITGNNSLSGNVFKDDGVTGGIFGNGVKDGTEAGIGAAVQSVVVSLYYDFDGDGALGPTDLLYGTTTTSAAGAFSFTSLPDGPYLVAVKKYDGATSNGVNDAVNDTVFGATGWGNTTTNPQLPLTTNQGILQMTEQPTTVTLAVNIDLARSNPTGQTPTTAPVLGTVNFGFAPPLRMSKAIAGNPDGNADGKADTAIDEGDTFTYQINLENRLPNVGRQGPTGCQYTVWATTGANGSPASKEFTNPSRAWDGPNRSVATALVEGGGNRLMDGTGFSLRTQAGNVTKVEALFFGYFSSTLTDDQLSLRVAQGFTSNTTTMGTALIDNYVGEPDTLDPNEAISWDITAARPGGGAWSFADNFATLRLEINPSKASAADQKTFSLDAIGLRVTTDQDCEAGTSTTLSPVPLQDRYDTGSFTFVSASPAPDSVNTGTGTIQWNDVGPILPGSTTTVNVTMRANNITGTRTGACGGSAPPALNSACNWAETAWGGRNVYYADGRLANDATANVNVNIQAKAEIRGTLWKDTNVDGWPDNDGEPKLPNIAVTLWGCVRDTGLLETNEENKTCENTTGGNTWQVIATTTTNASGAYEFIGLDTGYYLVEVGNTDGVPGSGSSSPFGGTQTAEPNDSQATAAGVATATNGVCAGAGNLCNNTWGWGTGAPLLDTPKLVSGLATEEIIGGVNFGYNIPSAVIYGNIWWDVNANALQGAGETGLAGFTVQRWSDTTGDTIPDSLQATTTTDANGNYSFQGLTAGSYVIVVVPPTLLTKSWVETVESTGGTGNLNNQIPVTVAAGAISGSHNFGYTQSDTADIGDSLYYDFDGDGVQDATEAGIPNITVWLYQDVDRDGTIDDGVDELIATTTSNGTGNYLFQNYPAGSYVVVVDTDDPDFPTDVLPTADPDLATGSIGDLIWLDSDGDGALDAGEDGIARVVVNLYTDTNGNGTLGAGDALVASTVTNVNGGYRFTGLTAGRYFVDVDETSLPSTALLITTTDPANTLITLATSSTQVLTADAGYSPNANFSIGNRIWHDADNDGVQDAGEPGIPNVDIVVTNGVGGSGCPGPAGCRVTTNAAGFWIVTGLTAGAYSVNVDNADPDFPRDFTLTAGSSDPRTANVTTADLTNIDFGYRFTGSGSSPSGTISGRVFLDGDGDLAFDAGEARSGTTVNLMDVDGNIVATTTTAADGTYSFTGIFVGTYSVQSVDTLGTRYSTIFLQAAQTFPNLNIIYSSTNETVADSQGSVSIDGVHNDLLQDFGYQRYTASIGDSVYWDVNENATQDVGEPGFSGVTVRLYDSIWTDANNDGLYQAGESVDTLVATTTTIADNPLTPAVESGTYLFSNLSSLASGHQYKVVVDQTTLPGTSRTLIADPDTDGFPCTQLPAPNQAPASVCDHQQLISGFLPGNNYLGADFGYRINGTGFATIGDRLWIDTDGDGVYDDGEAGVHAITVWLDTDNDGVVDWTDGNANGVWDTGEGEQWTQSDSDGFYAFTSVTNGTYNLKVLTSDPDWPSGLTTTPTFEVRTGNTTSRNNAVQVVVSGGAVTSIVDGDPATTDTCSSCNLSVDFGYRYAGTNALSGTVCTEGPTLNGYCGATATTYSGVTTGEAAIQGIEITAYRWVDDGDNNAWAVNGTLDAGDTFTLLGSASTNSSGDYSFANLPDNVILVFSVQESQNLDLTTDNVNTSAEDVISRQLYEGTTLYESNTVTVIGRQALSIGGDADDIIRDVDYAFDPTLGGLIAYDYGDLPTTYGNTLVANSGAQHRVTPSSIFLGPGITTENDGTQSATASADTADNGVVMTSTVFRPGGGAYIQITASAPGWVSAWMDFNGDGDFDDADEWILDQAVVAGVNSTSFYVPTTVTAAVTDYFSRWRIYPTRPQIVASSGPGLDSNFQRMQGEVEDHLFVMSIGPTVVEGLTYEAVQKNKKVTLTWQTEREVDNLGFHIYRQVSGAAQEKLNEHIITGSAFVTGRDAAHPRSYRFTDRNAPETAFVQYWIEDVDLDGTRTMHGPISPSNGAGEPDEVPDVTTEPDPTLGSAGGILTTAPGMGVKIPEPPAPGAAQREEQWRLAGIPAVKVIATQAGWYRVTKSQLVAAGFDPGKNAKAISVFTEGTEVPVLINSKNESSFDTDDSIEFFARGIDTIGTGGRVYYITPNRGSGLRVKRTGGRGNSGSSVTNFPYTVERVERTVFFSGLVTNGEKENFFGPVITTAPSTLTLAVTNHDATGNGELEVVIQGATENFETVVRVALNGSDLGLVRVRNMERKVQKFSVSANRILAGANTVKLTAINGANDVSVLESLRLTYRHKFRADNDALAFTVAAGSAVAIDGFTSDKITVIDVTDPMQPVIIDGKIEKAKDGTNAVSFGTAGSGTQTILAVSENRILAPAQIAWNEPSQWNSTTNGADLVIVTNKSFVAAAEALKTARVAQGYATVIVDVQNAYDEFSFGHHGPEAIRELLSRSQSWQKKPRYVILLGDASFDPRNYLGMGRFDFVPTRLIPSDFIKTASDDWFADFAGNGLPAMAIGRIPARTQEQAMAVINKLLARATPPTDTWAKNVDIVADRPSGWPFEREADKLAALVPPTYTLGRITVGKTASPGTAIINAFNRGALMTTWVGHGSVEMWGNRQFQSTNASKLTNGSKLPFVAVLNCFNGYFHDILTNSLAEALLNNPSGGAIGVWASSAMSGPTGQLDVALELNRKIFGAAPITIGDAILQAKQATADQNVRRTWILFGDPTMKLK
jgi:Peptidase family C25/SdrD B-like domain/GEVED domain